MGTIPIPEYSQRTGAQAGSLARRSPTDEGRGAAALGAALGHVADVQIAQREQRGAVWANERAMSTRSQWVKRFGEMQQGASESGEGFTKQVLEEFDASTSDLWNDAPTASAKQTLRDQLQRQRLALQDDGQAFEQRRGIEFKLGGLDRSIDAARIAADARPQDFDDIVADQVSAITLSGLSDEMQAKMRVQTYQNVGEAAVAGMIRRDPYKTLREINNEKTTAAPIRALSSDQRFRARNAAEAEIRQREIDASRQKSELAQALSERVRDASAAYRMGFEFPSAPTRGEFVAALGKNGNKAYESFAREQQLGADMRTLAMLSPDEQAKLLESRHPGAVLTHDGFPAINNPDGTVSTELGITVTDSRLNGGKPTNIPSIWQGKKRSEGDAVDFAVKSGRSFESFGSIDKAVEASKAHSESIGKRIAGEGFAETAQRHEYLRSQVSRLNAAKEADPAAYAALYSPGVRRAAAGMADGSPAAARVYATATLAEQTRLGVSQPKILPAEQASAIAQSFATQNGESLVALIASEQEKWGKHWPQVYGELAAKKLPPAALAIGRGMDPGPAARLASVAALPLAELQKGVNVPAADVKREVATQMLDFQRTLDGVIGAEQTFSGMHDAVERLSWSYMRQGMSASKAASQAYGEVLGNHYAFREVNGRKLRVPIDQDSDEIELGANVALRDLPGLDALAPIPTGRGDEFAAIDDLKRTIAKRGYWVTSADGERGAALFLDGAPVLKNDGSVYELTWGQLRGTFEAQRQDELRKAREKSAQGAQGLR